MKQTSMNIELIDWMGSDLSIVNAARVSFHKVSEQFSESDKKLLNYLAKHGHWSPFAHAFMSFRIKAPIFVARQLVKHQVGLSWNEVSRRYVDDEPEYFLPASWRARPESSIKQGSGTIHKDSEEWHATVAAHVDRLHDLYTVMIEDGVAPEQARMILPQSTMTEWIWSGSLMAFIRVCQQRLDPHAQFETQEVAKMMFKFLQERFPVSCGVYFND
jgi:thymidylate synthase (FAD)